MKVEEVKDVSMITHLNAGWYNKGNENHHLYKNGLVWWCKATLWFVDKTSERVCFNLKTKDVEKARERRDDVFADIEKKIEESK